MPRQLLSFRLDVHEEEGVHPALLVVLVPRHQVRGWRRLLAADLCLMALTMSESPGLAPSRSPACSAFSLISFSRLTCGISRYIYNIYNIFIYLQYL